jgi:hypothetical protein
MPDARATPGRSVTVEDVERLLTEAGAKGPWANQDYLIGAANLIESAANQLRMHESYAEEFALYAECREAAARLAKAVEKLNRCSCLSHHPEQIARRADLVRRVQQEFDLSWPTGAGQTFFRETLYLVYCQITGAGSVSRRGPAAKFVAAALRLAGWTATGGRRLTAGAVEQAMRRTQRKKATFNRG